MPLCCSAGRSSGEGVGLGPTADSSTTKPLTGMSLPAIDWDPAWCDTAVQTLPRSWGSSSSPSHEGKTSQLPTPALTGPTNTADKATLG